MGEIKLESDLTNFGTWWEDYRDHYFRYWVYRKMYTPYEEDKKFSDESVFESDEAKNGFITNAIELPDGDILIEFNDPGISEDYKEYYKLSEIRLAYNPDDILDLQEMEEMHEMNRETYTKESLYKAEYEPRYKTEYTSEEQREQYARLYQDIFPDINNIEIPDDLKTRIDTAMEGLGDEEQEIVRMFYGVYYWKTPQTMNDIIWQHDLSEEEVKEIISAALSKLGKGHEREILLHGE